MRNSLTAKLAILFAVISLVLFSTSAVYAGWGGWSSWGSWGASSWSSSQHGKSDKSDKSGHSDKSSKWSKSDKSDKSKGKWSKSDRSGRSDKSDKSDKSGSGHGHHDDPVVTIIEGNCAIFRAGQHTAVGSVCLTIIGDTVKVNYIMENGWDLSNPHLWIGDTLASAPRTRSGNPIPGQFPYNADVEGVEEYTFEIPVSSLNVNADLLCTDESVLLVGAHGEVSKNGNHESAWAGETRFTKKGNWATYFGIAPDCETAEPPPELQVCQLWEASALFPANESATTTPTLSALPVGSDILIPASLLEVEMTATYDGRNGSSLGGAAVITDLGQDYRITDAELSVQGAGASLISYEAPKTAEGVYSSGANVVPFNNEGYPEGSDFTLVAQVKVCEIDPLVEDVAN
ncbi:MAG: hypothetical protein WD071_15445 [Pseudohongiella sp.]|uniref:hypothetical protein n=1 Tax=Pseudohongiella sp. TaxID=1979412 RepID=UPI00349FD8B3